MTVNELLNAEPLDAQFECGCWLSEVGFQRHPPIKGTICCPVHLKPYGESPARRPLDLDLRETQQRIRETMYEGSTIDLDEHAARIAKATFAARARSVGR